MKTARYPLATGEYLEIDYDENAPCRLCGLPVTNASTDGTDICPWCAIGKERDGSRVSFREALLRAARQEANKKPREKLDLGKVRAGLIPGIRVIGKMNEDGVRDSAKALIKEFG